MALIAGIGTSYYTLADAVDAAYANAVTRAGGFPTRDFEAHGFSFEDGRWTVSYSATVATVPAE